MNCVQVRINLIEQVEGRGITALDGENERQRHHRLLPARQLIHALITDAGAGERHLDGHTRVMPRGVGFLQASREEGEGSCP